MAGTVLVGNEMVTWFTGCVPIRLAHGVVAARAVDVSRSLEVEERGRSRRVLLTTIGTDRCRRWQFEARTMDRTVRRLREALVHGQLIV